MRHDAAARYLRQAATTVPAMRLLIAVVFVLPALVALLANRRHTPAAAPVVAAAAVTSPASGAMVDDGSEPDEATLRRIVMAEYEAVERQGGMALTLTATGKQLTVHPKVHEAHKDECHKLPYNPGQWECGMTLMMTLHDGDTPSPKAERVDVKRGPDGRWVPT